MLLSIYFMLTTTNRSHCGKYTLFQKPTETLLALIRIFSSKYYVKCSNYKQHFHRNRSYWRYFYLFSNLGMDAERFRPRINDTVLKTQVAVETLWINELADLAHPSGAYRHEIYTDINQIYIKGLYWKIEPDCTTDKFLKSYLIFTFSVIKWQLILKKRILSEKFIIHFEQIKLLYDMTTFRFVKKAKNAQISKYVLASCM